MSVNRLRGATSPYLLQHADNPVHWWPWCDEAFAEAAERDVPVLLSVGYAACHWCHVMAHESFEDPATAEVVNQGFVPVKVDREERPDVDAVYMQATQALTGQGGWPMTVFLTPDRRPFYAGTYFPPRPRQGMPSFGQVLDAIGSAWRDRRSEVVDSAGHIAAELAAQRPDSFASEVTADDLPPALAELARSFDRVHGGFGGAPKFPPSMLLEALLRLPGADAGDLAGRTLESMARGGICDQLGGGFARYSVDVGWVVPHFEKMLYDNALLLGVYTQWWRRTGSELAAEVVERLVGWLAREMLTGEGGFAASLDADSLDDEGHLAEGAFYAWSPAELAEVLGATEAAWAESVFAVTGAGTFEHGRSTLQLVGEPDAARLRAVRAALYEAREKRPRPGRDDKVVAAWNGWLLDALVRAAGVFDRPDWLELAGRAADLLWRVHWDGARLRRVSRDGVAGEARGILEDYAALTLAFTRLGAARADQTWIERAETLAGVIVDQFAADPGFYDTAADAELLYTRPQDPTDNATPSGLSTTVHAFRLLGELIGDEDLLARSEAAAASAGALVRKAPRFAGWLLADAITRLVRPSVQVAVAGDPSDPATRELTRVAHRVAPAGSVVVAGLPDSGPALLADRPMVRGRPTAYVCRHFVCRLPLTDADDLARELEAQP